MTGMSKSIKTTQPCRPIGYLLESAAISSLLSVLWQINLVQGFQNESFTVPWTVQ